MKKLCSHWRRKIDESFKESGETINRSKTRLMVAARVNTQTVERRFKEKYKIQDVECVYLVNYYGQIWGRKCVHIRLFVRFIHKAEELSCPRGIKWSFRVGWSFLFNTETFVKCESIKECCNYRGEKLSSHNGQNSWNNSNVNVPREGSSWKNYNKKKFFGWNFLGSASGLIKKYFAYSGAEFDSKLAKNLISWVFSGEHEIKCTCDCLKVQGMFETSKPGNYWMIHWIFQESIALLKGID